MQRDAEIFGTEQDIRIDTTAYRNLAWKSQTRCVIIRCNTMLLSDAVISDIARSRWFVDVLLEPRARDYVLRKGPIEIQNMVAPNSGQRECPKSEDVQIIQK
jgi:hypothetical protein